MISLDLTLVFQIIGFFILLIILNRFLYNPVLRVLKERDEKIGGAVKKAAETEKEVAEGLVTYDKKIKEAAVKGHEERNRIRQAGIDREKELLEAARSAAAAEISEMRQELVKNKQAALSSLKEEARTISGNIAEKILERKIVVFLIAFGLTAMLPAFAGAAEHGEGSGSGGTWKIINFVILAVGVYLVWTKAVSGLLDKRSAEIKKALDEAKEAKDAADRKAAEYSSKLSLLDSRISEIHNELKLEGEAEKQKIIEEAGKAAVRVKEQAKIVAEQELKKAKLEIREEVARLAVGMAEEILKKELKPEDQERLVKGYLNNLRLN
jgi:F-type H+-transporting ATPase subunit b